MPEINLPGEYCTASSAPGSGTLTIFSHDNQQKLATKLLEVYKKVESVEKHGENKIQNYKYLKASDISRAIRRALIEVGVYALPSFYVLRTYEIPKKDGGVMQAVDVSVDIHFIDTETGAQLNTHGLGSGADGGDKAIYKGMTGAYKNALRNAFMVPDESDPEADEETDKATTGRPVRKAEKVQSKPSPNTPPNAIRGDLPHSTEQGKGTHQATNADLPELICSTPSESGTSQHFIFNSDGQMMEPWKSRGTKLVKSLEEAGLTKDTGKKLLAYILKDAGIEDKLKLSAYAFDAATKELETLLLTPAGKESAVKLLEYKTKEKTA